MLCWFNLVQTRRERADEEHWYIIQRKNRSRIYSFSTEWFLSALIRGRQWELSPIGQFHWDEPTEKRCDVAILLSLPSSPCFSVSLYPSLLVQVMHLILSSHAQTRLLLAQGNFLFKPMFLSSAPSHSFRSCASPTSLSSSSSWKSFEPRRNEQAERERSNETTIYRSIKRPICILG